MAWMKTNIGDGWRPIGLMLAVSVAGLIGLALWLATTGVAHGGWAMLTATGAAFGAIILVTLAPMPGAAKAVLSLGSAAAVILLSATIDPLGARAVDTQVAGVLGAPAPPPIVETVALPDVAPPGAVPHIDIRSVGTIADPGFATDLAQNIADRLPGGVPRRPVIASVRIDPAAQGPTYTLNFTLTDGDQPRWCGRLTIAAAPREAVIAAMARRIVQAIAGGGDGSCGS